MDTLFKTFLAKYNNTFVEKVDSSNLNQCFDLALAWTEWLGLPLTIFSGLLQAYQIYTNPTQLTKDNFTFIPNTPDGVPQAGDIVVWSRSYNGTAGHVGIASGVGDVSHFECFEQNDPMGSSSHIKDYNYVSVLGWLRYNKEVVVDDCPAKLTQITQERDRLNGVITGKDETIAHLGDTINVKNAEIATLNTTISGLNTQVLNLQEQLATATEQAKKVPELTTNLASCEMFKQASQHDLSVCKTQIGKIKAQLVPKKYLSLKIYKFIMALE